MTNDIKLQSAVVNKKKKKSRRASSLDKRKARSGWIFVLPFLLGFIFVYFPIIFNSIKLSFYNMKVLSGGGYQLIWVGFENYNEALFGSTDFFETLVGGLGQMVFDIPAIIIFSLFMAVLLNQKMAGRALFRAIFFIPVIVSTGIMESIEAQNLMSDMVNDGGGINDGSANLGSASGSIVTSTDIESIAGLFSNMMVGSELAAMVSSWVNNIFNIVNRSGVQMLIFLSGLQSISPAIYESCQIDGATAWETFWKITFPMISPMILVNAVYTVIDSFTTESNTIMTFIDSVYNGGGDAGNSVSAAMSWIYFLIVILIVALVAAFCSAFVFYQRKND